MKNLLIENSLILAKILIITIFFSILYFYKNFDPKEALLGGIFVNDAGQYRLMAEQLITGDLSNLNGWYPFAPRLLFPAFYSLISIYADFTLIDSAYLLNIFCSLFVVLFTFSLLINNGVTLKLALFISIINMLFWFGPLRHSNYNSGHPFPFEVLLTCILFWILDKSSTQKNFFKIFSLFLIFFLSLGREFIFYILMISLFITFSIYFLKKLDFLSQKSTYLELPNILLLSGYTLSSFVGFITARVLVTDTFGAYSTLNTIIQYGWFHAHILEFLYPFFYALGPIFLVLLIAILVKRIRADFLKRVHKQIKQLFFVLSFLSSGIIFAMIGGTDSDRFLLWFFPFFSLLGAHSFYSILSRFKRNKTLLVVILTFITLLWTRFYVPAIPHLFYPGYAYNSVGMVKTDFSPDLFYGPKFLEDFRLELRQVPSDKSYNAVIIDNPKLFDSYSPSVSKSTHPNPFKGTYRYEINNIPFPFGFVHNQYELLVAHPTFGNKKVKLMFLIQWLFALLVLLVAYKKSQ